MKKTKKSKKWGAFNWEKKIFDRTYIKKEKEVYFEPYKTNAEYYILEHNDMSEIGVLVFEHLDFSKRTRIWGIMIHKQYRRKGYDTYLIQFVEKKSKQKGQRSFVLERQNTNSKAIDFYFKQGFELIGVDLEAYT